MSIVTVLVGNKRVIIDCEDNTVQSIIYALANNKHISIKHCNALIELSILDHTLYNTYNSDIVLLGRNKAFKMMKSMGYKFNRKYSGWDFKGNVVSSKPIEIISKALVSNKPVSKLDIANGIAVLAIVVISGLFNR